MKGSSFSSVACFVIGYLLTNTLSLDICLRNVPARGWDLADHRPTGVHTRRGLWPANPKIGGVSPRDYVHGNVLRSLHVFVTSNPFAAFTRWTERATEKLSYPIHRILDWLHISIH